MSTVVYTMYGTWKEVMSVIRKNNELIYHKQLHYDYYEVTPVTDVNEWGRLNQYNCIKIGRTHLYKYGYNDCSIFQIF